MTSIKKNYFGTRLRVFKGDDSKIQSKQGWQVRMHDDPNIFKQVTQFSVTCGRYYIYQWKCIRDHIRSETQVRDRKEHTLCVTWCFYIQKYRHFSKSNTICVIFLYAKILTLCVRRFFMEFLKLADGGTFLYAKKMHFALHFYIQKAWHFALHFYI